MRELNTIKRKEKVDVSPDFEPVGNGWEMPDFSNSEDGWEPVRTGEFWIPVNEGEYVIGKILGFKEGLYGTYATIETDNGEIINTPSHVILQQKLDLVKPGEIVKIIYKGEKPTSKGRDVKDYEVFVRRR